MENWQTKKKEIASYYEELVSRYGHDPRACDYGRPESQKAKFRVLAEVMALDGKTVLDVGCGFADFADFLRQLYPSVVYSGVDITLAMVEKARAGHPGLDIRQMDILEADPGGPYDLVTANGIFYLAGESAQAFMHRMIARLFALSRNAVAFNSLSRWCADPQQGEFYADPLETVAFCRTLTPWVTLRHDYHNRDFTIYMRRERQA